MRIAITGGSSGIGNAIGQALVADGHEVFGLGRRSSPGLQSIPCDVSSWDSLRAASESIPGTLDVLVCCAGVQGEAGPTMELDPEEWKRTIAVNLDGTFFAIRAFYPRLRATDRRAKIVCFSGGGATSPRPNFSAYAVAKTGVVRLVENLAAEWNGVPIDINAIAPGAINTAMTEETLAAGPEKVGAEEYAKTLRQKETGGGSMQKVIDLVKFLISPESDGISGRLLAAQWDPFRSLPTDPTVLGDVFTLRRIVPEDRDLALPAQP